MLELGQGMDGINCRLPHTWPLEDTPLWNGYLLSINTKRIVLISEEEELLAEGKYIIKGTILQCVA